MSGTEAFAPDVYAAIRDGAARSAAIVVPQLLDHLAVVTVVDVGCGEGWWAHTFAAAGCDVLAIDGDHVVDPVHQPFVVADLTRPLAALGRFDLAVCLEVGEHLPERRAADLVADLCALADTVVFSAAIPHQTGPGHITCRWPSWWAPLFAAHGFGLDGRWRLRLWDDDRIEPWYRQNLLIATRGAEHVGPLDLVHPVIHEWGR